jgi:hypothetical protein
MKKDTDETVRVTVTFNRASNPEWFRVLSAIESGRSRSEIVRTHLSVPSLERFGVSPDQPQPFKPAKSEKINTTQPGVNSSAISTVVDGSFGSNKGDNKTAEPPKLVENDPTSTGTRRSSGGLAAHLVGNGFKSV